MPTTQHAVAAIARRLNLREPRVRAVARALTNAGRLPSGSPGHAPSLDPDHIVDIVIGSVLATSLRAVPATVAAYRALTPAGLPLDNAPASFQTAGVELDILAEIAAHGDGGAYRRDKLEIVTSWPEIVFHDANATRRFVSPGALASHWQASGSRASTTISGAAFIDAFKEIFAHG